MKRLTTLMIATLIATAAFAQSKNPTNKKEIDDKVKQAKQQFDKLTSEQKKMMEQLGINAAIGGDAFGVPSKNTALIGAIPQITLTAAMVPTYVKSLVDYVQKGVANDTKVFSQQMYAVFKTNKYDAMAIDQIFTHKFKKK